MNRHSFRWAELFVGAILVAAVGSWAVWRVDLLTARQLSLGSAGVLIVLGLVGIAATLRQARPAPPSPVPPDPSDETWSDTVEGDPRERATDPHA